jgi:hypothetical protein
MATRLTTGQGAHVTLGAAGVATELQFTADADIIRVQFFDADGLTAAAGRVAFEVGSGGNIAARNWIVQQGKDETFILLPNNRVPGADLVSVWVAGLGASYVVNVLPQRVHA